MKKTFKT